MKRWAIVGMGFVSPRHIDAIKAIGDRVVATCDPDNSKSINNIPHWDSFEAMVQTPFFKDEVDAVAICTPNCFHVPYSVECVAQRKMVICEKPAGISSDEMRHLKPGDNVNIVLQLRYHPAVLKLKKQLEGGKKSGKLVVKVKRGQSYWDGWKGKEEMSGGILFNIGIHYFDLLIFLFGEDYKIIETNYTDKLATGKIKWGRSTFTYHIEIMDTDEGQDRRLEIGGEVISLSKSDNLANEDLHTKVYKRAREGYGITAETALPAILMIEKLGHGI